MLNGAAVGRLTVDDYLDALARLMITEDLGAWTPLADWNYTGLLFENMALRDVRVYLDATGGTTYHYRDSNGLEVDIIAELDDGRWGAIEVKLGENRIEEGAESLAQLARTVDIGSVGQPSFLAVLTGANLYATRRRRNRRHPHRHARPVDDCPTVMASSPLLAVMVSVSGGTTARSG